MRCYPAYSGEMPTFPPWPASHLPHCLGDSIIQLLIVFPHWIIQFSYQLHYSISLPKSLPWSHPHISNSQHPRNSGLFSRKLSSLVLTCVTGTNLGAQDTNLSPSNLSLATHIHLVTSVTAQISLRSFHTSASLLPYTKPYNLTPELCMVTS